MLLKDSELIDSLKIKNRSFSLRFIEEVLLRMDIILR